MKDLKRASARGAAWNLLQNLISRVLGLIIVAILSRLLDRNAFGGVALALAIVSFAELLVNQGFGEFVTQTPTLRDEHLDTAFWCNTIVGAVLTGAIALTAAPLARVLGDPSSASIIRWSSLTLVLRSLSVVPAGLLVREMRFRSLSLRSLTASAVGGIAGIAAAFRGMGAYSLVIQLLIGDLAAWVALWGATHWRPGFHMSRSAFKDLAGYGTPIIGATLLAFASRRLDTIIVGGALGLGLLGVYSLAQRVFQITLQVLNKSSVEVVFSALSRLADTEDRRRQAFLRVIELTAVLCFPTYVGMAILARPVTVTMFGASWEDGSRTLTMFALSGVPFSLSLIHMAAMKSAARTRLLFVINLILMSIYLPSMLLLVERGTAPAAAASLISCTLIVPIEVMLLRTSLAFRVGDYLRAITGASLATAVMASAVLGVSVATAHLPHLVQLAACSPVGVVVYVIALRALAPTSFARCRELAVQTLRRKSPATSAAPAS